MVIASYMLSVLYCTFDSHYCFYNNCNLISSYFAFVRHISNKVAHVGVYT